ncbi:MAG: metallophosphoesterase family protein [Dehalococcoidia bacterium]|nr:metallophosphoesterase family protein [Dehalococcoidia bacterium]
MRHPVTILHASDLHLHWAYLEQSLWSLRALAAAADRAGAEAILMAGDIFDTTEQPDEFVDHVAAVIRDVGVPVVMIPGNHDIRYSARERDALGDLGLAIGPRHRLIAHADGESVALAGGAIHLWGRGMPEHSPRNDPLHGITAAGRDDAWSVAIAHGELTTGESSMRSSPIVLERHRDALREVHYVALGHHDNSHVTRFEETLVCYSGSASPVLGTTEYAVVRFEEPTGASVDVRLLTEVLPLPA